ncbi:hypothetical protein GCM10017774_45130 [Lentzea cavernae]|uniref:Uncharacterized protein n=1 Tax=Lentzea cavernae TaxID=2020703 RepID=A0ABQ3MN62_9PSEU|nr:hypothetical protein GCM10017774_45130 [Lentzea cavernae]
MEPSTAVAAATVPSPNTDLRFNVMRGIQTGGTDVSLTRVDIAMHPSVREFLRHRADRRH